MKLEALKQFIQKRGDTQTELAQALRLNRTTLNRKLNERDGAALTFPEMQAIATYYNIPLAECEALFFGEH